LLYSHLMRLTVLTRKFYERSTLEVTADLLGKFLVRENHYRKWIGKIVEVEAYIGEKDPACHAFRGLTPRTRIMYAGPGHAYVYFTYGMHYMLNVVTEREGFPAAVLIRALEPVEGFEDHGSRPASGPGKLCKALRIDKSLNGIALTDRALWIGSNGNSDRLPIRWSPRVGISDGIEKLWRAYIYGNSFVSRKSSSSDAKTPTRKLYR
jgi:DNA-3-methyladenine glycosylase